MMLQDRFCIGYLIGFLGGIIYSECSTFTYIIFLAILTGILYFLEHKGIFKVYDDK